MAFFKWPPESLNVGHWSHAALCWKAQCFNKMSGLSKVEITTILFAIMPILSDFYIYQSFYIYFRFEGE
jgi:hypothetical protein